jgi:hypothetical protein
MSISMTTVSTRTRRQTEVLPRHEDDWYVEPASAVAALIAVERFGGLVWDPCCGGGTIPDAMTVAGIAAVGSDLVDRAGGRFLAPLDFLADGLPSGSERPDHIVMNPPYNRAREFVGRARQIARCRVAMLGRLAFLESTGRGPWFATTGLSRVWVFSDRVSMPPGDKLAAGKIKRGGGAVAYAWFVWDREAERPTRLGWINSKGAR